MTAVGGQCEDRWQRRVESDARDDPAQPELIQFPLLLEGFPVDAWVIKIFGSVMDVDPK